MKLFRTLVAGAIALAITLPAVAENAAAQVAADTNAAATNEAAANAAGATLAGKAKKSHQKKHEKQAKQKKQTAENININTADAKTLASLQGIGMKKAEAIIAYRQQHGNFKSVDELANVKGISKRMIERNRDRLIVG